MQPAAASASVSCVVIVVFDVCLDQGWLFVPSSSIGIACIFRGCFNTANAKMKGKNALTGKIKPENFFSFFFEEKHLENPVKNATNCHSQARQPKTTTTDGNREYVS